MVIDKNKIFYISHGFEKSTDLPNVEDSIESIIIEGYASTTDVDRMGDVIPSYAWELGLGNFLKNPIILAYHDHSKPVGRMIEHRVDSKGLWIKARVSAAAEDVFNLVKDSVLTGFSVGFRVKDATYNPETDIFIITELELIEISLVSVPANQHTLFNLSKSFDSDEEYNSFKLNFNKSLDASTKGLENSKDNNKEEIDMKPEELKELMDQTASKAAAMAAQAVIEAQVAKQKEVEAEAAKKAADEKALNDKVESIVVGKSGAEKLMEEVEKRFAAENASTKAALEGLQAELREKSVELEAMQKSKMQFSNSNGPITNEDKEKAVLLSTIMGKSIENTKFGSKLIEKAGAHVASATWELEVSLNMESEVRRKLVVAPTMRSIQMQTNVMTIPVNPEAGVATWITNAQFGTTDSPGAAQTHQLGEITLNAYKVATREYLAYEEEEDALIAILPTVRDAMIRRVSRAVDRAFLRGVGSGGDPVKGLVPYDASSTVTVAAATAVTIANLIALRKDLGAWGLDPAELLYIVNTDIYYNLLDDTSFQTVDKVGDRATLLTGQVGSIGNTPVLVSSEFEARANTKAGALCFAPANFVVGNQRGLRFDTQDLVETQRRVLVSSLRTGMTQLTTNLGAGVSVLRYTA